MEEISIEEIQGRLLTLQDEKYKSFSSMLIPSVDSQRIIGVRTPELRSIAKDIITNYSYTDFLHALPHDYYEEDQIHVFLINETKDFDLCVKQFEEFLPYIDNWSTCDACSPRCFNYNRPKVLPLIKKCIASDKTYTVRFGISMLMKFFLDDEFKLEHLKMVSSLCRQPKKDQDDNYYINMMISWYFATALAKQWNSTLPFIKDRRLNPWCHSKTIQKAIESFRVPEQHKEVLKTFR